MFISLFSFSDSASVTLHHSSKNLMWYWALIKSARSSERARVSFRFYIQTFFLPACWSTKVILTSQNILPKICLQLCVSSTKCKKLHQVCKNITGHLFCAFYFSRFHIFKSTKTKKTSCVLVCTCACAHSVSSEHREKTHASVNRQRVEISPPTKVVTWSTHVKLHYKEDRMIAAAAACC